MNFKPEFTAKELQSRMLFHIKEYAKAEKGYRQFKRFPIQERMLHHKKQEKHFGNLLKLTSKWIRSTIHQYSERL